MTQRGGGTPSTNDAKVQQIQKEAVPNGSITTGDAETNGPAVSPIEYVPLPKLVTEIKLGMGIDGATPLPKAVAEAAEGLGIDAELEGLTTKAKANRIAEEMDLAIRTRVTPTR